MIWIIFSILILLLLFLVLFFIFNRKKKHEPDYYTFFIMGIVWAFFGLVFRENSLFFIMGLAFMVIGLVHKKDWKKNHGTWKNLNENERKWKFWLTIGLSFLVVISIIFLLLSKGGVL